MIRKNYIFSLQKSKSLMVYLLPLGLSLWGVGNVWYWEIYKGYSACTICKWHRVAYIALFISTLILFQYKRSFLKLLVWTSLILEVSVSVIQILGFCSPLVCRYVSLTDKLNLGLVVATLALTFIFECKSYLNHQKYLNLKINHIDMSSNFKIND